MFESPRASLGAEDQAEYDRLNDLRSVTFTTPTKWMFLWVVLGAAALAGVGALLSSTTGEWGSGPGVWWGVAGLAVLIIGLFAIAISDELAKRKIRRAMSDLVAHAAFTSEYEQGNGQDPGGPIGRNYPVTGSYNPQLYKERGGRATAASMDAWGFDDHYTYERNRPD